MNERRIEMDTNALADSDKQDIFMHQKENGPFSAMAFVASGLNYMDRLNRKRLDLTATPQERTHACRRLIELEGKVYAYAKKQTPLSLFDVDYREEAADYVQMRLLFLKATTITFKRHRLEFLLDLIRLYAEDPCCILTGREALLDKWERALLYDYLFYDMRTRNTEDVGKEAISNGYHECDFTLDIEDFLKQSHPSIPRTHFKYVCRSLKISRAAACIVAYMNEHLNELIPSLWSVDDQEIWALYKSQTVPPITQEVIKQVAATYHKF